SAGPAPECAGYIHRTSGPLPVTRYNARSRPSQPEKVISGSSSRANPALDDTRRRPVGGSVLSRIMRISTRFTLADPFGPDIGHLADVLARRAGDCSRDGGDVVPTGAGPRPPPSREERRGPRITVAGRTARSCWDTPPPAADAGHLADDPGAGTGAPWNQ